MWRPPLDRDGVIVIGAVIVLAGLVMVPHRLPSSPTTDRVERLVRVSQGRGVGAELDTDALVEGYYEGLLEAPDRHDSSRSTLAHLLRADTPRERPADWPRLHETGAVDRDDPFLRFTLRPDVDITYHEAPFRTSRWGHRDDDVELVPPAGTRRIAVAGASIAMGSGVSHDACFVERLETILNERHGPHEVVNLSVSGYRMTQLVDVVLDDVPRFSPDVVVIILSDIAVNPRWWLHLVTIVADGADPKYPWLREVVDEAGVRPGQRRQLMAERLDPYRDRVMEACLRRMIESTRSHGAEVVALVVPQPGHEQVLADRLAAMRGVLAEASVPVIDLLDAYDEVDDRSTLWVRPFDHHPNAEGHRLLFERLYERATGDPELARVLLGTTP